MRSRTKQFGVRLWSTTLLMLCSVAVAFGQARSGDSELKELSRVISKMEQYEVQFEINMGVGGAAQRGSYFVDAERYILNIAPFLIYGDSGVRYTVDNNNLEIVIESVDESMPIIVSNPAMAFVALDSSFDAVVAEESAEEINLVLTPKAQKVLVDTIELKLDVKRMLPMAICYMADGEQIVVKIEKIAHSTQRIPQLEALTLPDGYEVMDLR